MYPVFPVQLLKKCNLSATGEISPDIPCEVAETDQPCYGQFCSYAGTCEADENYEPYCVCDENYKHDMIVEGGVIVGEDVLACVYDPSTTTCRYEACVNDNPVAIPDDSSFIMSEIEVSSFIWTVNNVIIGIDITHPDVSELDIRLISPEGTVAFVGSFDGENLIRENINIDDFAYEAAEGIWTLQIRDTIANGNSGMLNSWSLKIEKSNLRF